MHRELKELRENLQNELIKMSQKGITATNLEMIDKLSHSIKSIDTILAMSDAGYSERDNDYSYARRDMRGRYSRTNYDDRGGSSYRRGMSRNSYGYSEDGAKADMIEQLQEMLDSTSDNKIRNAIQRALETME